MKQDAKKQAGDTYSQTRDALEFLYEEATRNKSFDMAQILLQALACCEQLINANYRPRVTSKDAIYSVELIKGFIDMDDDSKKLLIKALSGRD